MKSCADKTPKHHLQNGELPYNADEIRSHQWDYLSNLKSNLDGDEAIMSVDFGVKMKEACDKAGVECHLVVEGEMQGAADGAKAYKSSFEFLPDKLMPRS